MSVAKQVALADRMRRLGVSEGDLEERFLRSSGPGGQRTSKIFTCGNACREEAFLVVSILVVGSRRNASRSARASRHGVDTMQRGTGCS